MRRSFYLVTIVTAVLLTASSQAAQPPGLERQNQIQKQPVWENKTTTFYDFKYYPNPQARYDLDLDGIADIAITNVVCLGQSVFSCGGMAFYLVYDIATDVYSAYPSRNRDGMTSEDVESEADLYVDPLYLAVRFAAVSATGDHSALNLQRILRHLQMKAAVSMTKPK